MPAFFAAITAGISGFSSRGAEDGVDPLGDHRVHVGDLLRGGPAASV